MATDRDDDPGSEEGPGLLDRRSARDRRKAERRGIEVPVEKDRRSGWDRRRGDDRRKS